MNARRFISTAFALLFGAAQAAAVEPLAIADFSGGLNTWQSPLLLQENETPSAQNVLFDERGALTRREGFRKLNATAIGDGSTRTDSVYQLETSGGSRYCVAFSSQSGYGSTDSCASFTSFVSTLTRNNAVNCDAHQDRLYCVNNQYNFRFDGTNDIVVSAMPAALDYIRVHRNRCFVAGATGALSRLYYSAIGDCTSWTTSTDYIDISPEDGDVITGIGEPIFDMLPIYKKFSTWALRGATPSTWVLVNISKNTGAKNHRTIANFNNVQLFDSLGPNGGKPGVYGFNGIVVQEVSQKLRNEIDLLDTFRANAGQRIIDSKADYDAGTFDSFTMSSSRETGFMQSSFTALTDTTGADFGAFTSSDSVSTNAVVGSLTLQIASGTFVGGGFEQNSASSCDALNSSSWTIVTGDWRAGDAGSNCGAVVDLRGPLDADDSTGKAARSQCSGSTAGVLLEVLDENNNVVTSAGPYTSSDERALSLEGYSYRLIKIQVSQGNQKIRSRAFVKPQSLVHALGPSNADFNGTACSGAQAVNADFVEGVLYTSSGAFTSRVFDTSISTPVWGAFTVAMSSSAETPVTYQVQSATSSNGAFETAVSQSMTTPIAAAKRRYIRYLASFTTSVTTKTAQADIITINAASTGTWTSPELTLSLNMTAWGLFQTDQTTTGKGAAIGYSIRTATYATGAQYGPLDTITPGSTIVTSTGAYAIVYATFTITVASDVSKVNSITLNWPEGAQAISASAKVYNGRYHYAAQSNGGTRNDVIYVLDSKGAWTKWVGVRPAFLNVVNQNFVMADSSTTTGGFVFKLYDTDSDNGEAINAFWESKDFAMNGVHRIKAVDRVYTIHKADSTSVTMTLKADGGLTSKAYTLDFSTGASFGIKQTLVTPNINGNTFRLRYENNAASKPWEVLGSVLNYIDRGLMQ